MATFSKKTEILRTTRQKGNHSDYVIYAEEGSNELADQSIAGALYYPHMYTRLSVYAQVESHYNYADVYVTDRFTMDSYKLMKFEMPFDAQHPNVDQAVFGFIDGTNIGYDAAYFAATKYVSFSVIVPISDVMCGNLYVLFYDDENAKDANMYPVILNINNAPSVYIANLYKWRPITNGQEFDYDNVFNDYFGSVSSHNPNSGRTNVLTGFVANSDSYNDFMSEDRLISNGIRDTSKWASISGHPLYVAEYKTFVPQTLTDLYAEQGKCIGVKPITSAYLVKTDDFSTSALESEHLNIDLREIADPDCTTATVVTALTRSTETVTLTGNCQKFNAYIGYSDNAPIDRTHYTDEWFRNHTMLHADFELSGVDPYWMGTPQDP